ncbi:hypothetical protein EB796_000357 [Bugula neritina]|uniref:Uncharacterized protein n=1 Tax=Bugula neritina TaxID=10212 RepID=A0A7J7KT04_BUGNE|nr:hypothetical protein EB796_000357 [Bugula neritina]
MIHCKAFSWIWALTVLVVSIHCHFSMATGATSQSYPKKEVTTRFSLPKWFFTDHPWLSNNGKCCNSFVQKSL